MNPVTETSSIRCWAESLWKSSIKLTLPSETHTSWFCCCWMVSFNAPYQPSFMLFILMVARGQWQEGRHQITQARIQLSQVFVKITMRSKNEKLHKTPHCQWHKTSLVYLLINSSKGGSLDSLSFYDWAEWSFCPVTFTFMRGFYSKRFTNEEW